MGAGSGEVGDARDLGDFELRQACPEPGRRSQPERQEREDTPTPLPTLIADLPADSSRPAQTQFDLARQKVFLEHLATTGSVRSASCKAKVSHQTVYRARRANRALRRAWDAALLVARTQAEAVLADRAINGVEEEVWYHGEVVATRRRYDSRLLLAHLARLDKMAEAHADAAMLADDFDGTLEALEQGEALPEAPAPESSSGPCNMRSMSSAEREEAEREADRADPANWVDGAYLTPMERRFAAMHNARPESAPQIDDLDGDWREIEDLQLTAFELGVQQWWFVDSEAALDEAVRRGVASAPEGLENAALCDGAASV